MAQPYDTPRNHAVVMQPDEGPSYWQPMPANGHADPKLTPDVTRFEGLSMGYQTISPGGRIRAHFHADQIELQVCFRGSGTVIVDNQAYPLVPGTACFLGSGTPHEIINRGDKDLVMLWVISPPGLEHFFKTIGLPRESGKIPPAPFERPADVANVERSLGMQSVPVASVPMVKTTQRIPDISDEK